MKYVIEIVAIIAIIAIIIICLGVEISISFIAKIAGIILLVLFAMLYLFFFISMVLLLFSKKANGVFIRENVKKDYSRACYIVDGEEYENIFPMEIAFKNIIYNAHKSVKLRVIKKGHRCIDLNAKATILMGFFVLTAIMITLLIFVFI